MVGNCCACRIRLKSLLKRTEIHPVLFWRQIAANRAMVLERVNTADIILIDWRMRCRVCVCFSIALCAECQRNSVACGGYLTPHICPEDDYIGVAEFWKCVAVRETVRVVSAAGYDCRTEAWSPIKPYAFSCKKYANPGQSIDKLESRKTCQGYVLHHLTMKIRLYCSFSQNICYFLTTSPGSVFVFTPIKNQYDDFSIRVGIHLPLISTSKDSPQCKPP